MAKKMQHCFNCGEELGIFEVWSSDYVDCGKPECAREGRYQRQADDDETRERAAEDNFERYR